MNQSKQAYMGCDIFDGVDRHEDSALLVDEGKVVGIVGQDDIPDAYGVQTLANGLITAGFVDLQVNGGGGVMLNDAPGIDAMKTICDAHLPYGTTSLLPTLITDRPEKTTLAIAAAEEAIVAEIPGVIGLHLEGPHLSRVRKGAHDPDLIRPMEQGDLEQLVRAGKSLPSLMLTVAPESVSPEQISDLSASGATVSIGHTDVSFEQARNAAQNGASCVTHLFNAMSQLGNRAPGVVGAVLELGELSAGLIADGFHVDPATMRIALRAKQGPGKIFLVTDAMSTIGTDQKEVFLNGRMIRREGGRLLLEDGTLAGADLDMISAVRFMVEVIGLHIEEALRMASLYPAMVLGREQEIGCLCPDSRADFIRLNSDLGIAGVWQAGELKI